jgi:hypothetical protein
MGKLLPYYKKAIIDEIISNVTANDSYYYAFASNPIPYTGDPPAIANTDYQDIFVNNWQLLFGKKLLNTNFAAVIDNNIWTSNTVYRRYDNTDNQLYTNNMFYVIAEPEYTGGSYNFYKCIDNANGSPSTSKPTQIQYTTFETADGYKWRYLTSVSYLQYKLFSSPDYSPVFSNGIISIYASQYSGVDVVMISNSGVGYSTYHNGTIQSANSTVIQIETANTSSQNDFYANSGIYIYNEEASTGQLLDISQYIANTSGKWVYLGSEANTDNILSNSTKYKISPRVVFTSDGNTQPQAYSVVNTVSNSISEIVILDTGSEITWCNVHLTSTFGSGANLYAIVPPQGGHGYDTVSELNVRGLSVQFNFSNTEGGTIFASNVVYNKIGLIKNPYSLNSNNTKGSAYTVNTFSQLLKANVTSPVTFANGDYVVGNTSGALGTVVFSNTTQLYLTGDTHFSNGEYVISSNGSTSAQIDIKELGDLYIKDIRPIYIQNINNINRSNSQSESFKLIIQI